MKRNTNEPAGVVIENLNLSFGNTRVLKGVNLTILPGEFFAFLGPSGSGKSTLLRAIAGFGPCPSGRILIQGEDIARLPPWKRDVGMVFQSYALWPHMTVRKNVAFGLEERNTPSSEIDRRVDKALDMVGLLDLAERRPSQLSGGQQQRVALARTIVIEPKVLLLDEPLSNLDANLRTRMRREISELQKELQWTTIFVTHDQEEANTMSQRMAVLHQGVIQQVGTPLELYDNPVNLFVAQFLGTANIIAGRLIEDDGSLIFESENGGRFPVNQGSPACASSIVFRPQNVDIVMHDAVCEKSGRAIQIPGVILYSEFLGSIVRYCVDVRGDALLVDHQHIKGEHVYNCGDKVSLAIDRESVLALAA